MARQRRALFVVAHPDDELIFFGGTVRCLARRGWAVDVASVTGDFGGPAQTSIRRAEFGRAVWALGARARQLSVADEDGPLPETELAAALDRTLDWPSYAWVFTHGVWGEYGHPHHVQVSRAVHRATDAVCSLAGPFPPLVGHALSPAALAAKRRLAGDVYYSQPFAAAWCTGEERFVRLSAAQAEALGALALAERPPPGPLGPLPVPRLGVFADVAHIPARLWLPGHRARVRALARRAHQGAASPVTDFSK
jgi:LmbE family N-acetylglucosaminyl deacetylase